MKPFTFHEPRSIEDAVSLLGRTGAGILAGGSDLLGELKDGIAQHPHLVSLGRIDALREISTNDNGIRIGSAVTLAELEHEPRLTGAWGLLAEAARGVATPEIRNQGTLGGNLAQRPRCLHYRSPWVDCLKKGGPDCPALVSEHQHYLSVFGGGRCVAVHASDLAPALVALDAELDIVGPAGERSLPVLEFFAEPDADVRREHTLGAGELIAAVRLPLRHTDWRGTYLKARERTAGDFPLVSAAFGCRLDGDTLRDVRLVLGGVAPTPRPCAEAEASLEGQVPSEKLAQDAARAAFAGAQPLLHNEFKLEIGRALVSRAIGAVAAIHRTHP